MSYARRIETQHNNAPRLHPSTLGCVVHEFLGQSVQVLSRAKGLKLMLIEDWLSDIEGLLFLPFSLDCQYSFNIRAASMADKAALHMGPADTKYWWFQSGWTISLQYQSISSVSSNRGKKWKTSKRNCGKGPIQYNTPYVTIQYPKPPTTVG